MKAWDNEAAVENLKEINFPHLTGTPDLERARDIILGKFRESVPGPDGVQVEEFHYSNAFKWLLRLFTLVTLCLSLGKAWFWVDRLWLSLVLAVCQTLLFLVLVTKALVVLRLLFNGRGKEVGYNVSATIPARVEERAVLVVGAHYDTIAVAPVRVKFFIVRIAAFVLTTLLVLVAGVVRLFTGPSPLWLTVVVWVGTWVEVTATLSLYCFRKKNESPGSNDNGSGVVAVLELARVFAADPPEHLTLVLVAFDAEEVGLVGSTAYAWAHGSDLARRGARMLSLDMVAGKLPVREFTPLQCRPSDGRARGREDRARGGGREFDRRGGPDEHRGVRG
ncbi:MAG: M28 family metallopeptidase [Promethearchaeota archaeon]